jgi:hypothetical protein
LKAILAEQIFKDHQICIHSKLNQGFIPSICETLGGTISPKQTATLFVDEYKQKDLANETRINPTVFLNLTLVSSLEFILESVFGNYWRESRKKRELIANKNIGEEDPSDYKLLNKKKTITISFVPNKGLSKLYEEACQLFKKVKFVTYKEIDQADLVILPYQFISLPTAYALIKSQNYFILILF